MVKPLAYGSVDLSRKHHTNEINGKEQIREDIVKDTIVAVLKNLVITPIIINI